MLNIKDIIIDCNKDLDYCERGFDICFPIEKNEKLLKALKKVLKNFDEKDIDFFIHSENRIAIFAENKASTFNDKRRIEIKISKKLEYEIALYCLSYLAMINENW